MRLVSLQGEGLSSMCKAFGVACATSTIGIAATSISVRLLHLPSPLTCQPMTSAHFFYLSDLSERLLGRERDRPRNLILEPNNGLLCGFDSSMDPSKSKGAKHDAKATARDLFACRNYATVASANSERTCTRRGARDRQGTATVGQGVVQGTGQAGQGIAQGSASVARGAGQATVGVARGAGTVAAKTGKGTWCIITLGYGC